MYTQWPYFADGDGAITPPPFGLSVNFCYKFCTVFISHFVLEP